MNPVEPVQASSNDPAFGVVCSDIPYEDPIMVPGTLISASNRILAKVGGIVKLQGAFPDDKGQDVSYDISIEFEEGALPHDTTISISIDKTTFKEDGTVTFGPHGLVFKTPGTLLLKADNITFAKNAKTVHLYYLNNGTMKPMPSTWGSYVKKSDWNLVAGAAIPHFSRYAFGR